GVRLDRRGGQGLAAGRARGRGGGGPGKGRARPAPLARLLGPYPGHQRPGGEPRPGEGPAAVRRGPDRSLPKVGRQTAQADQRGVRWAQPAAAVIPRCGPGRGRRGPERPHQYPARLHRDQARRPGTPAPARGDAAMKVDAGRGKLYDAHLSIRHRWDEVAETWSDYVRADFEEAVWRPLDEYTDEARRATDGWPGVWTEGRRPVGGEC